MANVQDIIDYYANLLIIQYHNREKAQATIKALVEQILASGILFEIRDGYSVDTAVGVQLDVIGKYVGIDRFYSGQTFQNYFAFIDYEEVDAPDPEKIGLADYTDFESKFGYTLQYTDVLSRTLILNDDDYRFLIKLKIIQNNSNHSHKSIDDSMFQFFGTAIYADSIGNMEMFYFVPASQGAVIQVAIQKDLLPRPMGVKLGYIIQQTSPFFGFADYSGQSNLITGFSDFADFETKVGETLKYNKLIGA